MVLLLMTVSVAVPTLTLSSCEHYRSTEDVDITEDQAWFMEEYTNVTCPVFNSSDEMVIFHDNYVSSWQEDSIFRSLPSDVIKQISDVIVYKSGKLSKKTIVDEYRASRSIYDALHDSKNSPNVEVEDNDEPGKVHRSEVVATDSVIKHLVDEYHKYIGGQNNE